MNDDKNEKRKPNYFFYLILVILIIIAVVTVIVCVNKNHNVGTSNYKDVNKLNHHDEEDSQSLEAAQTENSADLESQNFPIGEYQNSNSFQENEPTQAAKIEPFIEKKSQLNTFEFNIDEFRKDIESYVHNSGLINDAIEYHIDDGLTFSFRLIRIPDIKKFIVKNATKENGGIESMLDNFEQFFLVSNNQYRLYLKSKYTYLGLTKFKRTVYFYLDMEYCEIKEENFFQLNSYSSYFEKENYIITVIYIIGRDHFLYGLFIIDDLIKIK